MRLDLPGAYDEVHACVRYCCVSRIFRIEVVLFETLWFAAFLTLKLDNVFIIWFVLAGGWVIVILFVSDLCSCRGCSSLCLFFGGVRFVF